MHVGIELPKAFSVRDEHEFLPIQHFLARLNPQLVVKELATGVHVDGGGTVHWGLVLPERRVAQQEEGGDRLAGSGLRLRPQRPDADGRRADGPFVNRTV